MLCLDGVNIVAQDENKKTTDANTTNFFIICNFILIDLDKSMKSFLFFVYFSLYFLTTLRTYFIRLIHSIIYLFTNLSIKAIKTIY